MGLLSNPKTRNRIAGLIACYNNKLCFLCYIVGLMWFLGLAYVQLNAKTYFSENALLPGLVDPDFQHGYGCGEYFHELKTLVRKRKLEEDLRIPSDWLIQKFSELRLDAYVHNYTFKYPFNMFNGKSLSGQNTYAVLRAPRTTGTEAIVLSAPFQPDQENAVAGISLMLGLAKAFKRHTYWAKDIIFLVTDNEEIGMQAWLSAYHHTHNTFIAPSELPGRSGSIQAAINLEIGTDVASRMDIRIEGLNGQLPNLDLVNTVIRLCRREGILPTLHKRADYWNYDSWDGFGHALKTMLLMMWHQAPGTPTGNHGLFHRYNIEAVTLHATKMKNSKQNLGFLEMGRVVEGVFRSLNNLLERFHQSFFFYLLPSTDRYVSIGLYMPPFGLLVLPVAIKAVALWLSAGVLSSAADDSDNTKSSSSSVPSKSSMNDDEIEEKEKVSSSQSLIHILCYVPYFMMALFFGIGAFYGPRHFISTAVSMHLSPGTGLAIGFLALHVAVLSYPLILKWKYTKAVDSYQMDIRLLKCFTLLALGIVLTATAVMNISLAFFISALWVPVVLLIHPTDSRVWQLIQFIFLIVISPFGLMCIGATIHQSFINKSYQDLPDFVSRAWEDIQTGLLVIAIQGQMLGNWTYGFVSMALLPIWILFRLISSFDIPKIF